MFHHHHDENPEKSGFVTDDPIHGDFHVASIASYRRTPSLLALRQRSLPPGQLGAARWGLPVLGNQWKPTNITTGDWGFYWKTYIEKELD